MKGRYSFYIESGDITWDIVHKADKVGGFIEKIDDDLIVWHSLKWREVAKAVRFVRVTWGIKVPRTEIYESHFDGACDIPARIVTPRRNERRAK